MRLLTLIGKQDTILERVSAWHHIRKSICIWQIYGEWEWSSRVSHERSGPVFSYTLRYIVGSWLVEMAISTNQKPTIYRNLYENIGPDPH